MGTPPHFGSGWPPLGRYAPSRRTLPSGVMPVAFEIALTGFFGGLMQAGRLFTSGVSMSLPTVNLVSGAVHWVDGAVVPGADVTGFVVGLRSLTAAGSAAGTYPIKSPAVAASAVSEALSAIGQSLKADDYAAAVQAQSANGPSTWSSEFQFTGVLPVPLAPTGVTVS
jgi:hypothetical protein